jgi:ankyrin repeat protein
VHRLRRRISARLCSCAQQDRELIVLQLRNMFDIDDLQADESSRILAHQASELRWVPIPSLLRYKSVPWLNHAAKDGRTALHVTVEHRNKLACEGFLNTGANYLLRGRLPVHTAAEQSHRAILALLLGCPIREYGKDRQGRDLLYFLVI